MRTAILGVLALWLPAAPAADVRGKWVAESETGTTVFAFDVEGGKVTGTVAGPSGAVEIGEGKAAGDGISFVVVREVNGRATPQRFRGKVAGDEIRFTVTDGAATRRVTARRRLPPTPRENLERRRG